MQKYHKIETLYKRNVETKALDLAQFRNDDFEYLKDCPWLFTEKVDGTNIRVFWDGYKVHFGGRTDNAQIPPNLMSRLETLFGGEKNEQILEQVFGCKEVLLFGEGYGGKIQGRGRYPNDEDFILFDVFIDGVFLRYIDVRNVAAQLGITVVPIFSYGATFEEVIKFMKYKKPKSFLGDCPMEGLIGTPLTGLRDRLGNRIIVKIKACDFD